MPHYESSLPYPLCLIPPKGRWGSDFTNAFTKVADPGAFFDFSPIVPDGLAHSFELVQNNHAFRDKEIEYNESFQQIHASLYCISTDRSLII